VERRQHVAGAHVRHLIRVERDRRLGGRAARPPLALALRGRLLEHVERQRRGRVAAEPAVRHQHECQRELAGLRQRDLELKLVADGLTRIVACAVRTSVN
jgi:hypothetical protein